MNLKSRHFKYINLKFKSKSKSKLPNTTLGYLLQNSIIIMGKKAFLLCLGVRYNFSPKI